MRSWLAAHRYAAGSAFVRFARRPLAAIFEATVLGIALALPLAFLLTVDNVRALASRHPAAPELSVYLALDADGSDIARLAERLHGIAGVEAVRFVSRSEASERLRQFAALADVLDALPTNPLPDAFLLRMEGTDAERLEALRRELATWPRVERVQVDSQWAQRLDTLVRAAWAAAVTLGIILGLAMVAITFNTVRLQMAQQREEIELSRLIGATDAFIRRPYLYFGALQGFLGAAIALALLAAAHVGAARELAVISTIYTTRLELRPLSWAFSAAILGSGALLGCLAAWLSVSRTARARELRR